MEDTLNLDCSRLQQFLPPEVWNLVATYLLKSSSVDLENLANSSAFFRDLLASQRTVFLFEKVLPLVASSVWVKDGLEGLPVSEVLNLRGVCSHWSTVVDKLIYEKFRWDWFGDGSNYMKISVVVDAFQSIVAHYPFTFLKNNTENITESIHKFLRHFEGTHLGNQPNGRNPFIWGNIHVETCHDNEENEADHHFLEGVTQMLSKYGSHLYRFSLYCDGDEFVGDFPRFVREWFLYMPNLKELEFSSNVDRWWGQALSTDWEFPKFKFLEKLVANEVPGPVFNQLIRRNNHISKLVVENVLEDFDFVTFPLPNLRILDMGSCYEADVEKIRSPQVQWDLERLRLEFVNDNVGVTAPFQVIQDKFASTLVYFELEIQKNETGDMESFWLDCKNCRLELPKLKEINLIMNIIPVCMDFLLGMKHNLEYISVEVNYKLPFRPNVTWTSGTIVQFMGFEGKMLESNIWMLFKKLKRIEVYANWDGEGGQLESRYYSRDEWMLENEYV